MQQLELVIEDMHAAIAEIVRALGGAEKVGRQLWPERTPSAAATLLKDCLNPTRRERLNPEQVWLLFVWARQAGFHGAMRWLAESAGYSAPEPVEPEDERARLMRDFVSMGARMEQLGARIEKLTQTGPALAAVGGRSRA